MPPRPRSPKSPKLRRNPCVQRIRKAAKQGDITDAQATKLIQDILNRAENDRARHMGNIQASLANVAGEMIATEKTNALIAKRGMLLSYKMTQQMFDYSRNPAFKYFGRGMEKYMELTDIAGKALGARLWGRLVTRWEADGVLDKVFNDLPVTDFYKEVWNLSDPSKAGSRATGNNEAYLIAKAWWDIKDETISTKNSFGAFINRSIGHIMIQTHDPVKLRSGGEKGLLGYSEKNLDEAHAHWRRFIDTNTRIDWNRTLDGGDKDKFLRSIFDSLAMDMHTKSIDSIHEVTATKSHGSLGNKLSSRKLLFFADAESALAYHLEFGKNDVLTELRSELFQSGRQIAILQRMGPNPETAWKNTRDKFRRHIEKTQPADWRKQDERLKRDTLDNMWFELSGASQQSVRPRLSRWTDTIKSLVISSHSGKMAFPSLGGDQAMMLSGAMYQGVSAMDAFRMRLLTLSSPSAERNVALGQSSFVAHSYMGQLARFWNNDIQPAMFGVDKINDVSMKLNLMSTITQVNERSASEMGSMILGGNASKAWDDLDPKYVTLLQEYSFDKATWDVLRHKAYEVQDYGGRKVITEELGEKLSDADVDAIILGKGMVVSPGNRARTRTETGVAIATYIQDYMHFSTGRPTLRLRALKGMGIARGHLSREASELFWIFKNFPVMAMFRAMENFQKHYVPKNGLSMGAWFKANNGLMWWASTYVAMTYMAGVLAQTLSDVTSGKNAMPLYDKETGMPIWKTVARHLARGGGAGILGDLLFSEFDRNTRDIFDVLAGPALGQATNISRLWTMGAKGLVGDDKAQERIGYYALGTAERNLPFLNLFYIRPLYDQMIGWQLKEALSPGVLRRMERSVNEDNKQTYWLNPTNVERFDQGEMSGKLSEFFRSMDDIDLSVGYQR